MEDMAGWDFEFKLQDYTQVKLLSAAFNRYKEPLLRNIDYFADYIGKENVNELKTPPGTPSKNKTNKVNQQSNKAPNSYCANKYPSRINLPLRGGKVNVICEEHRNDPIPLKDDPEWQEKKRKILYPALESNESDQILVNDDADFRTWDTWKRSIFPNNMNQALRLPDILLIASIWQAQVESLMNGFETGKIVNIELIRT